MANIAKTILIFIHFESMTSLKKKSLLVLLYKTFNSSWDTWQHLILFLHLPSNNYLCVALWESKRPYLINLHYDKFLLSFISSAPRAYFYLKYMKIFYFKKLTTSLIKILIYFETFDFKFDTVLLFHLGLCSMHKL